MNDIFKWLTKAHEVMEYGEIEIKLIYHQGQLISSEKHVIHKEKYVKEKKKEKAV